MKISRVIALFVSTFVMGFSLCFVGRCLDSAMEAFEEAKTSLVQAGGAETHGYYLWHQAGNRALIIGAILTVVAVISWVASFFLIRRHGWGKLISHTELRPGIYRLVCAGRQVGRATPLAIIEYEGSLVACKLPVLDDERILQSGEYIRVEYSKTSNRWYASVLPDDTSVANVTT